MILAPPAAAQQEGALQEGTLAQAKEAYQFAEYEEAIRLFSQIARDANLSTPTRQEAWRCLGRTYVVKSQKAKALQALEQLLSMEPPRVTFDPHVEPPPLMNLYYQVRKEKEGDYRLPQEAPGRRTLAIMDFTNSSVSEHERFQPLQSGFPGVMINYLSGATDLRVIERERLQWLLSELALQRQAGVIDPSSAVRMGKLLGAYAMVFGGYILYEEEMWISARVVEVETGEVLLAEQIRGDKDDFFELIRELSLKVAEAIDVTLEEAELDTRIETRSLDALEAYNTGLALLEQGKYQAAHGKFLEAQAHDPGYERAELRAQSIEPMLLSAREETSGGSGGR